MIERAVVLLVTFSTCVLSLPVTSGELENGDVKVMKCIVEALADVLSMPHPVPVSQECLDTLRTDDRLFSILRHHNFLREMEGIAVSGANTRAQLHGDIMAADQVTKIPPGTENPADQSMLEALGGPGERSILAQKRRRAGEGDHREVEEEEAEREEEKRAQESQESEEQNETGGKGKEKEKEEEEERKSRGEKNDSDERISSWMADRPEKGKHQIEFGGGAGGEDGVYEEKRSHAEDRSQEALGVRHVTKEKKDDDSNLTRNTHDAKSEERKKKAFEEEEEEDEEALNRTRSTLLPRGATATEEEDEEEEEEAEEVKRGNDFARWSRQVKRLPMRKKNVSEKEEQEETSSSQQEVAHHSREEAATAAAAGGEEEEEEEQGEEVKRAELQRSREEKELRNMALQRAPEEKRGLEEEGSAIRKSEEPEIASLAAIESELESVAQKLHQLRRG
ncbi:unnamed protein product [Boreogadus saida]